MKGKRKGAAVKIRRSEKRATNFGHRKSIAQRVCVVKLNMLFMTAKAVHINADVAELADALDSGSSESNFMWVQVPSSAP